MQINIVIDAWSVAPTLANRQHRLAGFRHSARFYVHSGHIGKPVKKSSLPAHSHIEQPRLSADGFICVSEDT